MLSVLSLCSVVGPASLVSPSGPVCQLFPPASANPVITPIDTGAVPGFLELKGDTSSAPARSARSAPAKKLLRKELVSGELYVELYKHTVPTIPQRNAWTIVTDGLKKLGQNEVVMTILQEPGETDDQLPVDALLYIRLLPDLARQIKSSEPESALHSVDVNFWHHNLRGCSMCRPRVLVA